MPVDLGCLWPGRGLIVTKLLERAFAEASKLSPAEQEVLACRLLAELGAEDEFDLRIAGSVDKLTKFAEEALEEHRAGLTEELDPDRL
jgi:hypothetical protein